MMLLLSKALSPSNAPNSIASISSATPMVSRRCPGKSAKRTRLPRASLGARILEGHATLGVVGGLAFSPLYALSVTMNLDGCGIDHGVFHVRPSETASNNRLKTSSFTQSRYRTNTVFPRAEKRTRGEVNRVLVAISLKWPVIMWANR